MSSQTKQNFSTKFPLELITQPNDTPAIEVVLLLLLMCKESFMFHMYFSCWGFCWQNIIFALRGWEKGKNWKTMIKKINK